MRPPVATGFWVGVLGTLSLFDYWCARRQDESTLSCATRRIVSATPAGPTIFTVALICASGWFWRHILAPLADTIEAIGDPRDAPTSGGPTTT